MVPDIFTRLIDYASTPKEVEATPENLAKWEKRTPGRVMHCNKCGVEEPFGKHGILYKSSGRKRNFGRCPRCRTWSWLVIDKRKEL